MIREFKTLFLIIGLIVSLVIALITHAGVRGNNNDQVMKVPLTTGALARITYRTQWIVQTTCKILKPNQ